MGDVGRAGGALVSPFWNRSERRLRAWLRVLLAVVVTLAVAAAFASLDAVPLPPPLFTLAVSAVMALSSLGVVVLWAGHVSRRPLQAYGLGVDRAWWVDLAGGLAIGTAVHLGAFLTYLGSGWASISAIGYPGSSSWAFPLSFAVIACTYTAVAVWEELVFRGIFIVDGADGLGWLSPRSAVVIASALSATVFGVLHFQQATTPLSLLFWVSMGAVLAFAFALTGRLALPIGIHLAYNLAGNGVFGITAVATDESPTLFRLAFTGPDAFVRLTGVVNWSFIAVGAVLTLGWVRWRTGDLAIRTDIAEWRAE